MLYLACLLFSKRSKTQIETEIEMGIQVQECEIIEIYYPVSISLTAVRHALHFHTTAWSD